MTNDVCSRGQGHSLSQYVKEKELSWEKKPRQKEEALISFDYSPFWEHIGDQFRLIELTRA